ncbi:hypothetical protein PV326_001070 [Microctonus aethiopoides]|nr:hypothetical protein PV326_001070 [Microctonus aethiopoides]
MPVEQIDDPELKFKPTLKLIQFVKKHVSAKDASDNIRLLKKSSRNCDIVLKLEDIKWINDYLVEYRKTSDVEVYLHELIDGNLISLPSPKITPRNPILEARIQKLTAQQNSRAYDAMTKNIDPIKKHFPEDTIAFQMKEMNRHLIAIVQFIFSVMAAFAFGFIGIELIIGDLDFGFRLLLGIICGLIVALAEIYFLAKILNEEECMHSTPIHKKPHQE